MEDRQAEAKRNRHRIEIKVTEEQKDLITRGAVAARQGISEFVRAAAQKAASEALQEK